MQLLLDSEQYSIANQMLVLLLQHHQFNKKYPADLAISGLIPRMSTMENNFHPPIALYIYAIINYKFVWYVAYIMRQPLRSVRQSQINISSWESTKQAAVLALHENG